MGVPDRITEAHPFVLREYQKGRKRIIRRQFLKDFSGICVTDGYEVYHSIARERNDLLRLPDAGSHARRDFADVVKSAGKEKGSVQESICYKAPRLYRPFHVPQYERVARDMPPEERLEQRKKTLPHWLIYLCVSEIRAGSRSAKMETGRATSYCINQRTVSAGISYRWCCPDDKQCRGAKYLPLYSGQEEWVPD